MSLEKAPTFLYTAWRICAESFLFELMLINQSEECYKSEVLNMHLTFMETADIVSLCTKFSMSPAVLFCIGL